MAMDGGHVASCWAIGDGPGQTRLVCGSNGAAWKSNSCRVLQGLQGGAPGKRENQGPLQLGVRRLHHAHVKKW